MNQAIVRPSLIPRPTWLWRAVLLFVGIWLAGSTIIPPALGAQDTAWTFKPLPDNVSYLDNLYFIDDQTGWAVGGADDPVGAVILKTMNAGDDWTTQLTVPGYEIVSLHFADANNGYAVGGKAYKTTNGGTDWVEQTVHDEVGEMLHDVSCISSTPWPLWIPRTAGLWARKTAAAAPSSCTLPMAAQTGPSSRILSPWVSCNGSFSSTR